MTLRDGMGRDVGGDFIYTSALWEVQTTEEEQLK